MQKSFQSVIKDGLWPWFSVLSFEDQPSSCVVHWISPDPFDELTQCCPWTIAPCVVRRHGLKTFCKDDISAEMRSMPCDIFSWSSCLSNQTCELFCPWEVRHYLPAVGATTCMNMGGLTMMYMYQVGDKAAITHVMAISLSASLMPFDQPDRERNDPRRPVSRVSTPHSQLQSKRVIDLPTYNLHISKESRTKLRDSCTRIDPSNRAIFSGLRLTGSVYHPNQDRLPCSHQCLRTNSIETGSKHPLLPMYTCGILADRLHITSPAYKHLFQGSGLELVRMWSVHGINTGGNSFFIVLENVFPPEHHVCAMACPEKLLWSSGRELQASKLQCTATTFLATSKWREILLQKGKRKFLRIRVLLHIDGYVLPCLSLCAHLFASACSLSTSVCSLVCFGMLSSVLIVIILLWITFHRLSCSVLWLHWWQLQTGRTPTTEKWVQFLLCLI